MRLRVDFLLITLFLVAVGVGSYLFLSRSSGIPGIKDVEKAFENVEVDRGPHPLTIDFLKEQEYPGSEIKIEKTLDSGSNYKRYLTSYKSEGLKIFALLTVPNGEKPKNGWSAIIFNHGYIPPAQYRTTERYIAYVNAFASNGYVVFRPDYRGHGDSEGTARGGYGAPDYTIDVLNALSSVKDYPDVDKENIGMWGHSMGGHITLRSMVTSNDIKAGVIWAGVVGSYEDLLDSWHRRRNSQVDSSQSTSSNEILANDESSPTQRRGHWRNEMTEAYGTPEENHEFWSSISATSYLSEISGPLQLHHGTGDTHVPIEFSENLDELMKKENKISKLFTYAGDDHNISANLSLALNRSVEFFDKYLKETDKTEDTKTQE